MTQRLVEAVLAGCLPLAPISIRSVERFTPPRLHVAHGADVSSTLAHLQRIAGTGEHVELIASCLRALKVFRVSRQLAVLEDLLAGHPERQVAT